MVREKIMLTPEQLTRLKGLDEDIVWLTEEIRRAEFVGLDVKELKERFTKMVGVKDRMIKEYGRG